MSLLRLDGNNLSDAIPPELGQLTNLQSLALSENSLSGSIPAELGQLTNLEVLALSENDLSGSIPAELGQLTNLQSLYLFRNSLSGAIPRSFTNLTVLERFWFNDTSVCEPQDPDLQAWLDGIDDLQRTNVLCLAAPEEASLVSEITENEDGSVTVVLSWAAVDDAAAYHLQISDADFAETDAAKHLDILHEDTVTTTSYTVPDDVITPGMDFYWRVRAGNSEDGPWSPWASAAATATHIEPIDDGLPQRFALEANYPNPFNPVTTITYAIPEAVHVTLIVYDVLGRERVRLVDEQLAPGVYEARFDAGGLPSGVYLYRLEAGSYRETKALTLAK